MTTKDLTQKHTMKEQHAMKLFQTITLIFLSLLWVGYFYSLYRGNDRNSSTYSTMILVFTLLNSDVLFKCEKTQYKALNILAQLESILFVVWAIITIVLLLIN